MTDRKQALQQLRDKVAAGDPYETMGHTRMCQMAFPKPDDFDGSRGAYAKSEAQQAILAWRNNSLDAAMALHEAVLPKRYWRIEEWDGAWTAQLPISTFKRHEATSEDSPARAWLLAVLDALIAQEPDT